MKFGSYKSLKLYKYFWHNVLLHIPEHQRFVFKRLNWSFYQLNLDLVSNDPLYVLALHNKIESIIAYKGKKNITAGYLGSSRGGHLHLVKYFQELDPEMCKELVWKACKNSGRSSDRNSINYLLTQTNYIYKISSLRYAVFEGACHSGHLDLVKEFLPPDIHDLGDVDYSLYNYCIYLAARYNHTVVLNFLLSHAKLPDNAFDSVLAGACRSNNFKLLEESMEKGSRAFNYGLMEASKAGNFDMMKKLLELGASKTNRALNGLPRCANLAKIVEGAKILGESIKFNEDGLENAITSRNLNVIKFVYQNLSERLSKYIIEDFIMMTCAEGYPEIAETLMDWSQTSEICGHCKGKYHFNSI